MFWRFGLDVYGRHGSFLARGETPTHAFDRTFERLKTMRDLGFSAANICDIGASDGSWCRGALRVFPRARYLCVEPLDENQRYLRLLSDEYPNVSLWQGCLGSQSGRTVINIDGVGSSILPGHWGNRYGVQREVVVDTLDNLVRREIYSQFDLIKLDVQGYELEVLKGARNTIREAQAVIAELSFFSFQKGMPLFHEVVGELSQSDFVIYDVLSLTLRPLDGAAGQADLLFLRRTHSLRQSNRWAADSIY